MEQESAAPLPQLVAGDPLVMLLSLADAPLSSGETARLILECAMQAFEASGASLALLRQARGAAHLESVAAVGDRSAFVRETLLPLDSLAEAARVISDGESVYVDDPHGLGQRANGKGEALSRWREGLDEHAYALLPISACGQTLGVLTIDWAEPRVFDPRQREQLEAFARLSALVLESAARASEPAPEALPAVSECVSGAPTSALPYGGTTGEPSAAHVRAFEITGNGVVIPVASEGAWGDAAVFRVFAGSTSSADAGGDSTAFVEVTVGPQGVASLAIGSAATHTRDSAATATLAGKILHAAALRAEGPRAALGLLAASLSSGSDAESADTWADACVVRAEPGSRALTFAAAGSIAAVTRTSDGRLKLWMPDRPPLGGTVAPDLEDRSLLLLPGDRFTVLCGAAAVLARPGCREDIGATLGALHESGGIEAVQRLLAHVAREGRGDAVVIVDVLSSGD